MTTGENMYLTGLVHYIMDSDQDLPTLRQRLHESLQGFLVARPQRSSQELSEFWRLHNQADKFLSRNIGTDKGNGKCS